MVSREIELILEEGGMDAEVAAEVVYYLGNFFRLAVREAVGVRWAVRKGEWCMDVWFTGRRCFTIRF